MDSEEQIEHRPSASISSRVIESSFFRISSINLFNFNKMDHRDPENYLIVWLNNWMPRISRNRNSGEFSRELVIMLFLSSVVIFIVKEFKIIQMKTSKSRTTKERRMEERNLRLESFVNDFVELLRIKYQQPEIPKNHSDIQQFVFSIS